MRWKFRLKDAVLISFIVLCLLFVSSYNSVEDNDDDDDVNDSLVSSRSWITHLCPRYKEETSHQEDLLKLQWENASEDTIYFTQTSCEKVLSSREACAIESASKHHPHRSVKIYMTAPSVDKIHPFMKVLLDLPKVKFCWLDLDTLFKDKALFTWHQQRLWMYNQRKSFAFISDAARTELLRRFGGTYIDLDAITLRPFPNITNWLARIDENHINMAVASFMPEHKVLQMITHAIPQEFDPLESDAIGPTLVTNTLRKFCPLDITSPEDFIDQNTTEYCKDITVFPINTFYPMSYKKEGLLNMFTVRKGLGYKFFREHKDAYSLHLFSSLTNYGRIEMGLDSILEEVARRNCPMIYDAVIKNNLIL